VRRKQSRSLVPQAQGAQWGLRAVRNAERAGVPLRVLLERAGLAEDACEIVLEGADRGTPAEQPIPPDPLSHARSLPEVLITYQMSGCDPPRDHGFPVRSIVPVHYAMASVKWLTGILVVDEPLHGYWQTSDYAHWAALDGKPVRRALGEMKLKSEIARPCVYGTL
jgi:DMSO/TMAO reductase YedYZ molybdopterin-dependent catalytic subunit